MKKEEFQENRIDGFEKFLDQKQSQEIIKKSTENNSNTLTNKKRERDKDIKKENEKTIKKTKYLLYKDDEDNESEIEEESSSSVEFENQENLFDNYLNSNFEDNEERLDEFYIGDIKENKK